MARPDSGVWELSFGPWPAQPEETPLFASSGERRPCIGADRVGRQSAGSVVAYLRSGTQY